MSRTDRFTQTDIKNQYYSDFLTNLNRHPVSQDIVRFTNEQAVIRSIKNLLNTNKGERFYQPKVGTDLNKLLFENSGIGLENEIVNSIRDTIEKHEPRAKLLDAQVIGDPDYNRYTIGLTILLVNQNNPVTFSVTLQRVR